MSINSDSFAPAPTRSVPSAWADGFRKEPLRANDPSLPHLLTELVLTRGRFS